MEKLDLKLESFRGSGFGRGQNDLGRFRQKA